MNLPLIDVVIPCYNTEQTLVRAVESVLQQNNLGHLWLIDDASTDNTFALALQLAEQYPDRISIEQMPKNSGVAMARNWGAMLSAKSAVEFVAFLDADDAYEPGALSIRSGGGNLSFSARYFSREISIKADKFSSTLCRTP